MPNSDYKQVLKSFKRKMEVRSLAVVKDIATETSTKVIIRTPEDTSRCRANWNPGINTIVQEFDESRRAPGGRESIERAKAIIKLLQLGNVYSISNSTPYVFELEMGSSQKAPFGFVGITRAEFPSIFERAVLQQAKGRA